MNQEKKSPKRQLGVLDLAHQFLRAHVREGDTVIDATCGRGNDTKLLCALAGESGRVIGFDIQQDAIDSASALLEEHGLHAELHLDSHANMEQYAEPESVSCIVFNFGWL
ncbi:MAG: methyltransferase domain-containing protein, partial [Oscillospiraceae bacterium]|nr:methyltransferase domain-containing protein [Oscillospiraceae bacterium]